MAVAVAIDDDDDDEEEEDEDELAEVFRRLAAWEEACMEGHTLTRHEFFQQHTHMLEVYKNTIKHSPSHTTHRAPPTQHPTHVVLSTRADLCQLLQAQALPAELGLIELHRLQLRQLLLLRELHGLTRLRRVGERAHALRGLHRVVLVELVHREHTLWHAASPHAHGWDNTTLRGQP
jgi:hypothetical protein